MKLAFCNEVFGPEQYKSYPEVFRTIAEIGYKGVEIAPFTLAPDVRDISPAERKAIVQAAQDVGLEIVGLHWLLAPPPGGLYLTIVDSQVRARTISYLKSLTQFCAEIGGKVMTLGSPKQRSYNPKTTIPEEARERLTGALGACAAFCHEYDVALCLEALAPSETNLITHVREAAELVGSIGSPFVGYMLDVKAMASMVTGVPLQDGISEIISQFGAGAGHFHANEPSKVGPGMPALDISLPNVEWQKVLGALADSGYQGWISVEPFDYKPTPETVAARSFTTLERALKQLPAKRSS